MVERNAGLAPERRIEFRVGIHLGDVVEEADGDGGNWPRGVDRRDLRFFLQNIPRISNKRAAYRAIAARLGSEHG